MYDANHFFVANPINRYSISARQNLKANPDGSIDLYIQNQSPGGDKESNWLPAPKQVRFDVAHVLAKRKITLHNQWNVDATGRKKGQWESGIGDFEAMSSP